ncbi:MAG: alpha-glucosidase/alpha-galactosidase [Phycisphaerae bacterium]
MPKITFMGAGSTIFAKSVLGDCMLSEPLKDSHIALYDIDAQRLEDSRMMLENLNANINDSRATITAHLGPEQRKEALRDADYAVNAIQVGGYEPATVADFEIPKKYGLRQTIADTLGIGSIFRSLRTIPVVLDFCRDMQEVCPDVLFLNYVNPMAMITGAILEAGGVKAVGLCHSVQGCARSLLDRVGMREQVENLRWKVAGINHQAWLLEIRDGDKDLYPKIKEIVAERLPRIRKQGAVKVIEQAKADHGDDWRNEIDARIAGDMVRLQLMLKLGYYITESTEHMAEYVPWFIKSAHPELIDEYAIPLDEYPRRCVRQIAGWEKRREEIVNNAKLSHERTHEYGSYIMESCETGKELRIHGNVLNDGLVTNLPRRACVEVPCLVDFNGVQPVRVGDLPEQCAAVNRTNVNVQLLTVDAAVTGDRDRVYQAAMMDPHTAAELTIDEIVAMCDDLFEAHSDYLPQFG